MAWHNVYNAWSVYRSRSGNRMLPALDSYFLPQKKPHLAFVTLNKMANESSVGFSKLAKQILFEISEMIG